MGEAPGSWKRVYDIREPEMPEAEKIAVFKTARFKVHNPSRHKRAMLFRAMAGYHAMLDDVLQRAVAMPTLLLQISEPDKKGKLRPNTNKLSKLVNKLTPTGWELAPLRDYLVGDATAMLLSHLNKEYKGKHESNPPTMPSLEPISAEDAHRAYEELTDIHYQAAIKPELLERIEENREKGHKRVAKRMQKVYESRAFSRAAGEILRKSEGALPRPIEFTRCEFQRGLLLAERDGRYYALVRLFDRHTQQANVLADGFRNLRPGKKAGENLSGKKYPGLILPLEMGREFHEMEYLRHGRMQSAKLVVKEKPRTTPQKEKRAVDTNATDTNKDYDYEFYIHIAFRFEAEPLETTTYLGIDRGAVKIGAATVVDADGRVVASGIEMDGVAFKQEMAQYAQWIAEQQRRGKQRLRRFSVRGKRAEILLGEYANRVIEIAVEHRSQIVLEDIKGSTMARLLKQSQFTKLKTMLEYKAQRAGLPKPIEVPAAYSSQTCMRCGHKDKANRPKKDAQGRALQDVFRCVQCGYAANADDNASYFLAVRGLHQWQQGGRFQKFDVFQHWLKENVCKDNGREGEGGNA